MRYRPFGVHGMAVSAVSLMLRDGGGGPAHSHGLTLAGMENGINAFEIAGHSPALLEGVGEALQAVERRLLFIGWRIQGDHMGEVTAQAIGQELAQAFQLLKLSHFDLITLDETAMASLSMDAQALLGELVGTGAARYIGVAGEGQGLDGAIDSDLFEVMSAPFDVTSGWATRRRIKAASAADMTVIGVHPAPPDLCRPPSKAHGGGGLFGKSNHQPLEGVGTYAFLHRTDGWTPDEICLGYALTEPALATVQVEAAGVEDVERLANVAERELPTGVSAQIEMARFGPNGGGGEERVARRA
jgi:aryl-alcohol dehydrogenase-like predicted oxidoreductase